MLEPGFGHPARERLVHELLAWGGPRPRVPEGLADGLRRRLETGVAVHGERLRATAAGARGGRLVVSKRVLERAPCDGLQRDPVPFRHTWSSARGALAHQAIALDLDGARARPARKVVATVWRDAASRRPGDPASLSSWLNERTDAERATLAGEVEALLHDFREVWPQLPEATVRRTVRRPREVGLAGGLVALRGVPDVVLDSPLDDGRARALVVDLRTGLPRPVEDRRALHFDALLVTLAEGRTPWRWATYYVVEGRAEREELEPGALDGVVAAVLAAVAQLVRLGSGAGDDGLRIAGGPWCGRCRRAAVCPSAEPDTREVSHPGGTMGA